ncbi:MAG: hypothetical protein RLZZ249_258 [Actinomycetota bacterium]|jgi:FkbM family methyltransferase
MSELEFHSVIVDVGGNNGGFAIPASRLNPSSRVISIEPIEALASEMQRLSEGFGLKNLEVVRSAIGPQNGQAVINISSKGDWGTSSLLNFNNEALTKDPYWKSRSDLSFDAEQMTPVQTLENLCTSRGISRIDFLKIDAQGMDLQVLQSSGTVEIAAGMLEAPSSRRISLYQNEPDLRDCLNFLDQKGFDIEYIKPNDPACNEFNVFFGRPGEFQKVTNELRLNQIHLFSGFDFWHFPRSKPIRVPRLLSKLASIASKHEKF